MVNTGRVPEPAYRQVAAIIRGRIDGGELAADDPVPSIQELVTEYGISIGTVRKAIGVLIDDGLVYTVPGKGTFVRARKH